MNMLFTSVSSALKTFVKDEEGAQIIEYALIIAVVSLALIGSLATLVDADFTAWINAVGTRLNPPAAP